MTPADIKYASIYDSFTITVLMQIEDLGFCEKGKGGKFVADGNLISGVGKLPFNTDGGGLCNNHPANRGGITKVIEAVRQLRGEAHPKVQVHELRPGAGARHRRLARHAARQRHPDSRRGTDPWRPNGKNERLPAPTAAGPTQAVWDAAPQGRLLIKRCTGVPASSITIRAASARSACRRQDRVDRQRQGTRRRSTPTTVMRREAGPYAMAYVTLDEGVRMLTNIVDCDLDALKIGQKVKVVFKPTDGDSPPATM